jgi:hypothetical protein
VSALSATCESAKNQRRKRKLRPIIFIIIAIVIGIIGFIVKMITKGRMMKSLGREVGDHELTSLNSWMEVHDREEQQNRNVPNNPQP